MNCKTGCFGKQVIYAELTMTAIDFHFIYKKEEGNKPKHTYPLFYFNRVFLKFIAKSYVHINGVHVERNGFETAFKYIFETPS